jgi:SAM-dependent methyltransferase
MTVISTVVKKLWRRATDAASSSAEPPNLRLRFVSGLRGRGVEIGALASPLWLPPGAQATFVDKFDYDKLCAHNPDVPAETITRPEIVCDTATLDGLADGAYDFLIACHLLEHAHDPIRALLAWHRVLKPGGVALCIVPDARHTFDSGRPLTSLEHLLWDYANAGTELKRLSDLAHVAECNLNMHPSLDADSAVALASRILRDSYDTHFHVWTFASMRAQLEALIRDYGLPFAVRDAACDERVEMLFLLETRPRVPGPLDRPGEIAPRAQR